MVFTSAVTRVRYVYSVWCSLLRLSLVHGTYTQSGALYFGCHSCTVRILSLVVFTSADTRARYVYSVWWSLLRLSLVYGTYTQSGALYFGCHSCTVRILSLAIRRKLNRMVGLIFHFNFFPIIILSGIRLVLFILFGNRIRNSVKMLILLKPLCTFFFLSSAIYAFRFI